MNHFNTDADVPKIKITIKDLNTPEKVENFVSLFGRSNYYKVRQEFSEQIHGTGMKEKLENMMGSLDLEDPEEFKKYENLRSKWKMESEKLKDSKNAEIMMPIYNGTQEEVFKQKDLAKDYLGPSRYYDAAGFGNGREAVDKKGLRKDNPHIKEVEQKNDNMQKRIEELDKKRSELLRKKKGMDSDDE